MSAQQTKQDFDTTEVFRNLMRHTTVGTTGEAKSDIRALLSDWLGTDPVKLPGYSDNYWGLMHINVQVAIDTFLAEPGREGKILGVHTPTESGMNPIPFSKLLSPPSFKWGGATIGLAEYKIQQYDVGQYKRCVRQGLVLFRDDKGSGVIWITHAGHMAFPVFVEVLTSDPDRAPELIDEIKALSEANSPYKGKMFRIRLEQGVPVIEFMSRREPMTGDDLILPEGILPRLDQHTIAVSKKRKKLKRLGMHLKRGILLHGPPGTGKTHTIRYLASNMPESTVMILQKAAISLAHVLMPLIEPAVVVLDDVDLVAENRALPGMTDKSLLFQALEALDGLQDTDDVLFVLTTNRADTMEPAIAARPGRVDQTIEIPRPDDSCRRRLFELYRKGVDLRISDEELELVLKRTEGVTASFFKELLRRATVKAVKAGSEEDADGRVAVHADVLFAALDRMLDPDNPMTRLLLGAEPEHALPGVSLQDG